MTNEMTANTEATSVASGLMIVALADLLVEKGVFSRDDVFGAFEKAFQKIGNVSNPAVRVHGPAVIAKVMRDLPKGR